MFTFLRKQSQKQINTVIPKDKILVAQDMYPFEALEGLGAQDKSVYIHKYRDFYRKKGQRNRDSGNYFVKNHHHNQAINMEILAAKLAGLTGIAVPWTTFGVAFEDNNKKFRRALLKRKDAKPLQQEEGLVGNQSGDEKQLNYFIASQSLSGYRDFSRFMNFVFNNLEYIITDPALQKTFSESRSRFKELEDAHLPSPERKLKQAELVAKMLHCFPQGLKDQLDEIYLVSIWLGNWDILNFEFGNIGYQVRYNRDMKTGEKHLPIKNGDGEVYDFISIAPAIVDFGNCLVTGFGGKLKADSLEDANRPAKRTENAAGDEDPDLDDAHKIKSEDAGFSRQCEMLRLESIPRRLPFEKLFCGLDKSIQSLLNNGKQDKSVPLSKGFLRGVYRVTSVSDEAIEKVVDEWFFLGKEKGDVNIYQQDKAISKEELTDILKSRRDHLKGVFKAPLQEYCRANRSDVLSTDWEMDNASRDILGMERKTIGR